MMLGRLLRIEKNSNASFLLQFIFMEKLCKRTALPYTMPASDLIACDVAMMISKRKV